jgi:hypothetical protein
MKDNIDAKEALKIRKMHDFPQQRLQQEYVLSSNNDQKIP